MIRGDKEWYIFLAGKRWKLLSATLSNAQSYNLQVTLISKILLHNLLHIDLALLNKFSTIPKRHRISDEHERFW